LVLLILGAMLLGCGKGGGGAESLFSRGAAQFQDGHYDRAIELYRAGLEKEPESARGQNLLGMAYRMQYNTVRDPVYRTREIEAFRRAVAADSTFWPALINLGATLYYQGEKKEAARHFRRALELNPENPEREELERMIAEGEAL